MTTIIHWFRRDLRLTDNTSLNAAHRDSGGRVIPAYIRSSWQGAHRWTGAPRQKFLCGSLAELVSGLEELGGRLIVRAGCADAELERLVHETRAGAIYYNRDPDPFGRAMEAKVSALAARLGIRAVGFKDIALHERDEVLTATGTPFRVFTPYSKAWLRLPHPRPDGAAARWPSDFSLAHLPSLPLPSLADWGLTKSAEIIPPGEPAGRRRMDAFFSGPIYQYAELRNIPASGVNSHFSADLRQGTLSIREVVKRCGDAVAAAQTAAAAKSVQTFLNELIWREFYMTVLWHWPEVLEHEFQPQFRGMAWLQPGGRTTVGGDALSPDEAFQRWRDGITGFPIVDAGMRQLAATGFMHNRVRMIVAMFLTKDLHLDWRLGEQFFLQRLADGDIAANNGGWQWSAGTGADAAPYFRIQNPWTQTAKFDPEGEYIKRWVPELQNIPADRFTKAPQGIRLTPSYPLPMVDHAREREVTLDMYRR